MKLSATVTSKGQVTLPSALRQRLRLEPGDKVEFTEQGDGSVILRRKEVRRLAEIKGIVSYGGPALTDDDLAAMVDAAREEKARE